MKRLLLLPLALALLLTACQSSLARNEQQYLAEGYRKLNPYAYVREKPGGHSFSFLAEGELGQATVLSYLRDRESRIRQELGQRQAQGRHDQQTQALERQLQATEQLLESLSAAFQ